MARCQRVVFSATLLHIGRLRLLNLRPEWFVPSTLLRVVQPGRQSVLPLRASSLVTSLCLPFWAPPGDLGGITRRHVLCSPTTLTAARAPSLNLLRPLHSTATHNGTLAQLFVTSADELLQCSCRRWKTPPGAPEINNRGAVATAPHPTCFTPFCGGRGSLGGPKLLLS